jgi:RecA-family ATPase
MDEAGKAFLNNLRLQLGSPDPEEKQIEIMRGDTLLSMQVEAIPMLFEGLIPQIGLVAEVGTSDVGKSMLYRQLAMCCAKGEDFLCFPYKGRYKSAIYVSTEDDAQATAFLLRRQNKTVGMTSSDAHRLRFVYNVDDPLAAIRSMLGEEPADIVVIDAYSDVFNGKDSNVSTDTRRFLNDYARITKDFDTCVAFLHHTGKRTEDLEPSKNNAVGSQSFEAKMRLMFEFRADREDDNVRHLCIVKGNYLPAEAKRSSYVLRMNPDFCFDWTGGRRPFEELAKEQQPNNRQKSTDDINENVHLAFLKDMTAEPKTKNQLNELIRQMFKVGDKVARRYVEEYINKKWIEDVSNGQQPARYQYAKGSPPF